MAFIIDDNRVGWQAIADVSDTQRHPLGQIVRATDPTYGYGEFIYLKDHDPARAQCHRPGRDRNVHC